MNNTTFRPFVAAAIQDTEVLCVEWLEVYPRVVTDRNYVYTAARENYDLGDPTGHDLRNKFAAIAHLIEQEIERKE